MNIHLTRRQIIIATTVVLLLIIIVIVLLFINKNKQVGEQEFIPQVYDAQNVNGGIIAKPIESIDDSAATVMAVARNFIARYLSYSNENWGENINALNSQMTDEMLQKAQQDLVLLKNEHSEDEFYGVSAKVLSQNIVSEVGDNYILLLSIQLQKTIGSVGQVDYVKYEIDLVSSDNTWLVDNLFLRE